MQYLLIVYPLYEFPFLPLAEKERKNGKPGVGVGEQMKPQPQNYHISIQF